MKKYLVVDIGTSSVRAAVVDEKLQIRKTETIRRTVPENAAPVGRVRASASLMRRVPTAR